MNKTINKTIIEQFKLLVKQIQYDIDFTTGKEQIKHMFRLRSITRVLSILEKYPKKITSSEQLKDIKFVGKKSLMRIDEILKTGKLSEIKIPKDIDKYLNIITELEDVFGIGRRKAYELFMKHNIRSVEDLKKYYKKGKIELPSNIVKGLQYVDKIEEHIPRAEIDELNDVLMDIILKINPKLIGVICGSYRREKPYSNDVDIVLCYTDYKTKKDIMKHNYLTDVVRELKKKKIIIDSLTSDDVPTKYMGIFKLNNKLRRIDIRYIPYESFYSAILYFTGSGEFNRRMRLMAIDMDYILNEYGLYDSHGKRFDIKCEKDIFDILNLEYLTPDKRD